MSKRKEKNIEEQLKEVAFQTALEAFKSRPEVKLNPPPESIRLPPSDAGSSDKDPCYTFPNQGWEILTIKFLGIDWDRFWFNYTACTDNGCTFNPAPEGSLSYDIGFFNDLEQEDFDKDGKISKHKNPKCDGDMECVKWDATVTVSATIPSIIPYIGGSKLFKIKRHVWFKKCADGTQDWGWN
jgi:hypothetical protein